jgi:hypothetical protein
MVLMVFKSNAQVKIGFNVNIGVQPEWGPVGYDHAEYYYLPDIESYYYVPNHQFVYLRNNRWVFATSLPARYNNFNIYTAHKIVLNEPQPYLHFQEHRDKYTMYRNCPEKHEIIRESNDDRYQEHWHDNGKHRGWDKRQDDGGEHREDHHEEDRGREHHDD